MPVVTRYPSTDTAVSGTWTNPTNVQADDGAVASVTIGAKNTTNDREQGGFGFDAAIPAGSTINSVQIEVEHRVTTTGGVANLENLARIGTTDGAINSDTLEPTTLTARTYPNYARPGGGSWTRADLLDGTFKTRTRARSGNNATSVTYEWDYIRVTVDYSAPVTQNLDHPLKKFAVDLGATFGVFLDVASGNLTDFIAGKTCTANGGLTYGVATPAPNGRTAIDFDGSTGYFAVADHDDIDLTTAFTIAFAARSTSTTAVQELWTKGNAQPTASLTADVDDKWGLWSAGNGNIVQETGTTADGGWHQIALTWDGTTGKIYKDGADVSGVSTARTITANADAANIGRNTGAVNYFAGDVGYLLIFKVALTAAQVRDLHDAALRGPLRLDQVPQLLAH